MDGQIFVCLSYRKTKIVRFKLPALPDAPNETARSRLLAMVTSNDVSMSEDVASSVSRVRKDDWPCF